MDHNFPKIDTSEHTCPGGWITRAEFVERARISPSTAKRWARQGIGPKPIKLGPKLIRYARTEVEAWLLGAREAESGSPHGS